MKELTLYLTDEIDDGAFRNRTAARGIIVREGKYLVILGRHGDCKFPGGGMEQGETLQETLFREVCEETGFRVRKDSIRDGFLVHERRKEEKKVLIMDSYYYFCEIEQEEGEHSLSNYESGSGSEVSWLTLPEMIKRNESVQDFAKTPWAVREMLVMRELVQDNRTEV